MIAGEVNEVALILLFGWVLGNVIFLLYNSRSK